MEIKKQKKKKQKYFFQLQRDFNLSHNLNQKIREAILLDYDKYVLLFSKSILIVNIFNQNQIQRRIDFEESLISIIPLNNLEFVVQTEKKIYLFNQKLQQQILEIPQQLQDQEIIFWKIVYFNISKKLTIIYVSKKALYCQNISNNKFNQIQVVDNIDSKVLLNGNIQKYNQKNKIVIIFNVHQCYIIDLQKKGNTQKLDIQTGYIQINQCTIVSICEIDDNQLLLGVNKIEQDLRNQSIILKYNIKESRAQQLVKQRYLLKKISSVNVFNKFATAIYDYRIKQNGVEYQSLFLMFNISLIQQIYMRVPTKINKLYIDMNLSCAIDVFAIGKNDYRISLKFLYDKKILYLHLMNKCFIKNEFGQEIFEETLKLLVQPKQNMLKQ